MSQRVDILARTPGLLDLEIAADKRSFTLGIEGISEQTRGLPPQEPVRHRHSHGAGRTPCPQDPGAEALLYSHGAGEGEGLRRVRGFPAVAEGARRTAAAPPRLLFSFGLLVRMPGTPLRHDPPLLEEASWRQGSAG